MASVDYSVSPLVGSLQLSLFRFFLLKFCNLFIVSVLRKFKLEEVNKMEQLAAHPNCAQFIKAWEER